MPALLPPSPGTGIFNLTNFHCGGSSIASRQFRDKILIECPKTLLAGAASILLRLGGRGTALFAGSNSRVHYSFSVFFVAARGVRMESRLTASVFSVYVFILSSSGAIADADRPFRPQEVVPVGACAFGRAGGNQPVTELWQFTSTSAWLAAWGSPRVVPAPDEPVVFGETRCGYGDRHCRHGYGNGGDGALQPVSDIQFWVALCLRRPCGDRAGRHRAAGGLFDGRAPGGDRLGSGRRTQHSPR